MLGDYILHTVNGVLSVVEVVYHKLNAPMFWLEQQIDSFFEYMAKEHQLLSICILGVVAILCSVVNLLKDLALPIGDFIFSLNINRFR